MIPTYSYAIKAGIINNYLGANLAIALINNVALGITDTPTNTELEARRNFRTLDLFNFEIGVASLNGYHRQFVPPFEITPTPVTSEQTETEITVIFTASGGDFEPFTHIVALRGANTVGANPITNGNNRADTNGTIIWVEPVDNVVDPGQPLILSNGSSFNYTFKLISAAELV
jgi:hypothetical protein